MLVLALDAATPAVLAAVLTTDAGAGDDGGRNGVPRLLAESREVDARRHGELLAPAARAALAAAGARPGDLDAVVVGLGPGPFTSLRVGVVTAAALAHAAGIPVHGVCSLDAVGSGGRVVVTDARRREVYWAAYDAEGRRTAGPAVETPAALADRLRAGDGPPGPLVGPSAPAVAALLPDRQPGPPDHPDGTGLVRAAQAGGWAVVPLTPVYLRRPDAVAPAASPRPVTRPLAERPASDAARAGRGGTPGP